MWEVPGPEGIVVAATKRIAEGLAPKAHFGGGLPFSVMSRIVSSIPDRGIRLSSVTADGRMLLEEQWRRLGIDREVHWVVGSESVAVALSLATAEAWMPDFDVFELVRVRGLNPKENDDDLLREIWLSLLNSPMSREFPSAEELLASVRMRFSIVRNSERTFLKFDANAIDRPPDCWSYSEETGFVLKPGCSLVESLKKACQPSISGKVYSFSCSRATEYVLLLAIAEEAERSNRKLFCDLESQWQRKAIQGDPFRDAFTEEYGSFQEPLPMHYYVPGDRVWFRNPDEQSGEAMGFEGSWMFYAGGGLFANFWKLEQPYELKRVCVRIFHWRNCAWLAADGEWYMDEPKVERMEAQTLADPTETLRVMAIMHRMRDPGGIYAGGGCMDATREAPRFVLPPHCAIRFPTNGRESESPSEAVPLGGWRTAVAKQSDFLNRPKPERTNAFALPPLGGREARIAELQTPADCSTVFTPPTHENDP